MNARGKRRPVGQPKPRRPRRKVGRGDSNAGAAATGGASRGGETRARLIEGTLACLNKRGLAGTTARDIARASGVNLAGIGYHFGSKDKLVAEALLEAIRGWIEPAAAVLRSDLDPVDRMIRAVQVLQESFERARALLPSYLEALVHAPRVRAVRDPVRALFGEVRDFLADQIRSQQRQGALPAWVDPEAMATLQIATANGLALQATLDPGAVDHRMIASQAMQLLIAARATGTPSR